MNAAIISTTRFSVRSAIGRMSFETFEQAESFARQIATENQSVQIFERRSMGAPQIVATITA